MKAYNLSDYLTEVEVQKYVNYESKASKTEEGTEFIVVDEKFIMDIIDGINDYKQVEDFVRTINEMIASLAD